MKPTVSCPHERTTSYQFLPCPTPYCSGSEAYCPDCRTYIVECLCGYLSGVSGWSSHRWDLFHAKKHRQARQFGILSKEEK